MVRFARVFVVIGWCCLVAGTLVLLGWLLHSHLLRAIIPGAVTMKVNTASAFVLLGIGLLALGRENRVTSACAGLVALLAALSLLETASGWNLGIDQLLAHDDDPNTVLAPGRMASTTALAFLLSAVALWWLSLRRSREVDPFVLGWLGTMLIAVTLFSTVASWAGFFKGMAWELHTRMAVNTGLLFVLFGMALLWGAWRQSQLRLNTTGWLMASFILGLLLLSGMAAINNLNSRQRIKVLAHLDHIYAYLTALDKLHAALDEQERFLENPKAAKKSVTSAQEHLAELKGVPYQVHRQALEVLENNVLKFERLFEALQAGPAAPDRASPLFEEARAVKRQIDRTLEQMHQSEYLSIHNYVRWSERLSKRTMFFLPMTTFVGLVLLTFAFFQLYAAMSGRQKLVEQLRESEERFRTLADLIPQQVWIADPNGQPLWYNQRYCEYTGLTNQKLLQVGWRSLAHPALIAQVAKNWEKAVRTGIPFEGEISLRSADGHYRRFLTLAMPLRDENGNILRWFGTNTDIEESKRILSELERKEVQLRFSQQVGRVGGFDWDLLSGEMDWSPELESLYGMSAGTFGRTYEIWAACVYPEDLPGTERRIQEAMETGLFLGEFRIVWPDRSIHWIGGRGSVVRDQQGRPARMIGVNYDITEMKQAEAKVRELNLELERRVQERTFQLQTANKELESFSYSVSHDLRAPLRALDGFSRMLQERYAETLDDEGQRMLGILRKESQRMAQLIDDLLAFSRLGRQPLEFRPVDMQALAHSAFEEVMGRNADRRVELKLNPLPMSYGEQSMLRQVWVNLLDNAVKFTKKSDPARIELGVDEKPEEQVYFVRDNGVGFDMRYVGKLFDVFQRLHSDREFAGTGVGLALVKRIVQRHGGRVWAEGEIGKGATFYFALPNQRL